MKFLNENNLPAPMYHALTWDTYTKGRADISVTELLKSPRQRCLTRRHDAEIEIDASQNLWTLLGRACHNVLRESTKHIKSGFDGMAEERIFVEVTGPEKTWTLGGEFDLLYQNGKDLILADYKVSGAYGFILERQNGLIKPEWEKQLNIYRWMLHKHGFNVTRMEIGGIIRDWTESKKEKEQDYPQAPIVVVPVALWPLEEVERLINDRIALHQLAEKVADEKLPLCSAEERWERGEKWAVMEKGKKRAFKLFETEHEARDCAKEINGIVEHRPGISMRCAKYCYASKFCSQYKEIVNGNRQTIAA